MPTTAETPPPERVPPRRSGLGVITRQQHPANVEFPFEALDTFTTPNTQFYIRSHFPTPDTDARAWRLKIEGHVANPYELSLDDIHAMARHEKAATLECAGNGRVFLAPQVEGAQWELGAVSTARWTGVRLADVLARASVQPGAVEVMFEGADHGTPKEKPLPSAEIHYAHSIPMRKVPDALLAFGMNGQPLPKPHGFPLRAIIPGWYGMASVKWVQRIVVLDQAFRGYFRTVDYAYWTDHAGHPVHVPIEEMSCKAQIARPAKYELIGRGQNYTVTGAAWTGDTAVVRVEISTDGGVTFHDATLQGENVPHAWRFWTYHWHTPATPGPVTLLARATDARGRTQPFARNRSHGTYIIDHMLPVECEID